MSKIKLLFVIACLDMGGAEKSLVRLCSKLNSEKYDITILVNSGHKGIISSQLPDYVKTLYIYRYATLSFNKQYPHYLNKINDLASKYLFGKCQVKNRFLRYILRTAAAWEYKKYLQYITDLMAENQYDISVGFIERDSQVIATHCINAKKYILFWRHGNVFPFRYDDQAFEKCNIMIALSEKVKEDLVLKKNYDPKKIQVIHNVYDPENIIRLSDESVKYNKDILNIVSVGRLHPDKGQLDAIKAASILKQIGVNFNWFFVGLDEGDYADECKNAVEKFGLHNKIIFTGVQKNPYNYIKIANIYVLPSKYESLGNTLAEAMILGKPIVSTSTHGALELIKDGKNGILCGFAPEDIATAIKKVISDENLRNSISSSAKQSAKEFDSEIEKYTELFSC